MTAETLIHQRTDIHPSIDELLPLAAQGNLVPIYRELPADLDTPVSVYLKLAGHGASFLLESVEGGEQIGRYSFIGVEPSALLTFNGRTVTRRVNGRTSTFDLPAKNDPLHVLQAEMARFKPVTLPGLPRFVGGLVGYLGYDVIRFFEPKLDVDGEPGAEALPESIFMLADTLVAFDHARGRLLIIANAHLSGDPYAAYTDAVARLDRIADQLLRAAAITRHSSRVVIRLNR